MEVLTNPLSNVYFMLAIEHHTPGHVSKSVKLKRVAWNVTAALLFRPFITSLFRKWRIALLRLFGAKVEWDANVYASVRIWAPWMLQMGHRACLGPEVICYNQDWVVLEDDASADFLTSVVRMGKGVDVGEKNFRLIDTDNLKYDFHLSDVSAAIGAADAATSLAVDRDGVQRTATPSAGCYEYSGE